MSTLYEQVLGQQFAELHPVLRRFHASAGGSAAGRLRVVHYGRRVRRLLVRALGLPPAGDAVEVRLAVAPTRSGERWRRWFDGRELVTEQSIRGDLLLERHGIVGFGLAVQVARGGLVFRTRRVWLFGLPLPGWCAPAVQARVRPRPAGWALIVQLRLPGLGPLLRYQGEMLPS
jgi:hypothetical protein